MWSWNFWKKKFEKGFVWAGVTFVVLILTGFFPLRVEKTVIIRESIRPSEPVRVPEREPLTWYSRGGEGGGDAVKRLFPNLKEVSVPPMHFGEDRGLAPVRVPPMHFGVPENPRPRFECRHGRWVRVQ